jgi:hypothetical protein
VEAGRLEGAPHLCEGSNGGVGQGDFGSMQKPVDVEAPEPDPLHVKRMDRARQRLAFLEQGVARAARRLLFYDRDQLIDPILGVLPMISTGPHSLNFTMGMND